MGYATLEDLHNVLPAAAFGTKVTDDDKLKALGKASTYADSMLAGRYTLPILADDGSIKDAVAAIACYRLLIYRGFNPQAEQHVAVKDRHDDAMRWLEAVRDHKAHPQVTDSSPGATPGRVVRPPRVVSPTTDDDGVRVTRPRLREW